MRASSAAPTRPRLRSPSTRWIVSDVGALEQSFPGDERRARGLGALGAEVRAPGEHLHAEGAADRCHAAAEPAEAEDRKRPAVQRGADALLPAALAHAPVLVRDVAHGGKDQAPGELRRRVLRVASAGVRDGDAALLRGGKVERAVVRARPDDELQPRQPLDQRARHRHALAHQAEDVEPGERRRGLVLACEVAAEDHDLAGGLQAAPVGHRERHALVVVEDGDAGQRRVPSLYVGRAVRATRPPRRCARYTMTKVTARSPMPSTEMAPRSPLSFKS